MGSTVMRQTQSINDMFFYSVRAAEQIEDASDDEDVSCLGLGDASIGKLDASEAAMMALA